MTHSAQHSFNSEEMMAYLDGELEPSRASALAGHLEHCEECRTRAAQFRQISERLLDFEIEPSPESMSAAVLGAFDMANQEKTIDANIEIPGKPWSWRQLVGNPYAWTTVGALAIVLTVVGTKLSHLPTVQDSMRGIQQNSGAEFEASPPPAPAPLSAAVSRLFDSKPNTARGSAALSESQAAKSSGGGDDGAIEAPGTPGLMIAQTASLTIIATNYDEASAAIDRLAVAQNGYVQKLTADAQTGSSRQMSVTLRVPVMQLNTLLGELRKLGHVQEESRANDEVTDQYVDLQARLKSAQASEQGLVALLGTHTGKLEDVLDVERELARVRGEIESMEGQRILLAHRVDFATVDVQLQEEYRATLDSKSSSIGTKIWNASVEGFENLEGGVVMVLLFLLAVGPSALLLVAVLFVPARLLWRRLGHYQTPKS